MESEEPGYLQLYRLSGLEERIDQAQKMLSPCRLCPRNCAVDRLKNETGFCKTGRNARVASCGPHFGEEAPLVGRSGSGTIFFLSLIHI
jgi:putative pyruvate formate lyase activating enzyme